MHIVDPLQILFLISGQFKQIDLYSPWIHQKSYGFLIILGGTKVN